MNPPVNPDRLIRIDALAAADCRGVLARPASIVVRVRGATTPGPADELVVEALGSPAAIDGAGLDIAERVKRPRDLLLPALVNAHTHLDLSHIGPRPFDRDGGFLGWVDMIRRERRQDEAEIAASVAQGIELLTRGGCVAVGDIAGSPQRGPSRAPRKALGESALGGVSFLEFFATGAGAARGAERALGVFEGLAPAGPRVRPGLSPHATYSVSLEALGRLAQGPIAGVPMAIHVAESPEEHAFIADGHGPLRDLLERIGVWGPAVQAEIGHGRTPIRHIEPGIRRLLGAGAGPVVLVHCNQCSDDDLEALGRLSAEYPARIAVAYCPRASAYFGAPEHFGAHRYREMLTLGVPVVLGTDSIVNCPTDGPDAGRLSTMDEARLLHQRDGVPSTTLLRMCTVDAARALGLDWRAWMLEAGNGVAGLVGVDVGAFSGLDPLEAAFSTSGGLELLLAGNHYCETGISTP